LIARGSKVEGKLLRSPMNLVEIFHPDHVICSPDHVECTIVSPDYVECTITEDKL